MPVHSLHVFDRKGKTLFTKRYVNVAPEDEEYTPAQRAEQRKLVFGMLFSLREVAHSLTPKPTGAATSTTTAAAATTGTATGTSTTGTTPATSPTTVATTSNDFDAGSGSSGYYADGGIHSIQTGASTLYSLETNSGLRFALYVSRLGPDGTPLNTSTTLASSTSGVVGGYASYAASPSLYSSAVSPQSGAYGIGLGSSSANLNNYNNNANNSADAELRKNIRAALQHIYNNLWINNVTRSPLYNPVEPNVSATSFEQHLDAYLQAQPWYR